MTVKQYLEEGRGFLGIELGSTRIKAEVIDDTYHVLVSGTHTWENRLVDGIWTYTMEDVQTGLQAAYRNLLENAANQAGASICSFRAIGVSAMMHGYLPFDAEGNLLTEFRTWRNTTAHDAAEKLTRLFQYNIPDRWSCAFLYQSILDDEEHVRDIRHMTTLAGYIHYLLTGRKVIGIGDASGVFPVDMNTGDYRKDCLALFDLKIAGKNYPWKTGDILPKVLRAGMEAGYLTEQGAGLLDSTGSLRSGIPLCPPEGDAATGMIATNSIRRKRGNLSAGTSGFLLAVLDNDMQSLHREIEQINTPDGFPVAMIHANNCTGDISSWVSLFGEFADIVGTDLTADELYGVLFRKALEADADAGGIYACNFHAGDFIAGLSGGCPLLVRKPDASFSLANFMRAQIYGTVAVLRIGVDLLRKEGVSIDSITAHGGLFRTPEVAQRLLAGALKVPFRVMENAGEGGAFGIAVLAAYLVREEREMDLPDFLDSRVFTRVRSVYVEPFPEDMEGFDIFMEGYKKALSAEREAVRAFTEEGR